MWEYVVQCWALADKNKVFINELIEQMKVLVKNNVQEQVVSDVNKDLKSFLINYEKEYITNQSIIGWE